MNFKPTYSLSILVLLFKWNILRMSRIARKKICIFNANFTFQNSLTIHIFTSNVWACTFPHFPESSTCYVSLFLLPIWYLQRDTLICNLLTSYEEGILDSFSVFSGYLGFALLKLAFSHFFQFLLGYFYFFNFCTVKLLTFIFHMLWKYFSNLSFVCWICLGYFSIPYINIY